MLYTINSDEGRKRKYAESMGVNDWPELLVSCPVCKREWRKSLMFEYGTFIPFVLFDGICPDFLSYFLWYISECAKKTLEIENITGYILDKAQILTANDLTVTQKKEMRNEGAKLNKILLNPPLYYKLHVEIGAVCHDKSKVKLIDECKHCGYEKYISEGKDWVDAEQYIVNIDSYNGNDLFLCKGYGNIVFCNEKFVEVYNKHHLTGLNFKVIEVV